MPKPAILDPAGVAIEVDGADEKQLHEICHDLLSTPVVEDYKLEILS